MKTCSLRNILCILSLLLLPLLFTSCIDYVQAVSYSDGMYHIYTKITLNKAIFAMAGQDPEEFLPETDEELEEPLAHNATAKRVDTELDIGVEFTFNINPRTKDEDEIAMLPTASGNTCYIPFIMDNFFGEKTSLDDMDDAEGMGMLFLADAKCRVLISKRVIPNVKKAYFEGLDGEDDYEVALYDYGDEWCAEIPFLVFYGVDTIKTDRLVVLKE